MSIITTRLGTFISRDKLTKKDYENLTVRTRSGHGKYAVDTIFPLYKNVGKYTLVAPFAELPDLPRKNKMIRDNPVKYTPGITLRDNQTDIFNTLEDHLDPNGSCILVAPTGSGKTFISCALIAKLACRTLVVLPGRNAFSAWEQALPLIGAEVGYYNAKTKIPGDVVLITLKSAVMPKFKWGEEWIEPAAFYSKFDFIIIDEIHNTPTPVYSEIFWRACAPHQLGITATPDENAKKLDCVYQAHWGPLVKMDVAEHIDWKGDVTILKYNVPEEYNSPDVTKLYGLLCSDPARNELIVREAMKYYNAGRTFYIFSGFRDHLDLLAKMLSEKGVPLSIDGTPHVGKLRGGEDQSRNNDIRVALATYSYAAESISIQAMDAMILATPRRRKIRQVLGRITRTGSDESICRLIIDIVDVNTLFRAQMYDRRKIYTEKKFNIRSVRLDKL